MLLMMMVDQVKCIRPDYRYGRARKCRSPFISRRPIPALSYFMCFLSINTQVTVFAIITVLNFYFNQKTYWGLACYHLPLGYDRQG